MGGSAPAGRNTLVGSQGASLRRWLRSASHMSAVRGRNGAELRRPGQPAPCGHPCLHRKGPVCQLLAVREASARGPVRAIPPAPADTSRSCRRDREPRRSRALTAGAATPSPCCRDTGRTGCRGHSRRPAYGRSGPVSPSYQDSTTGSAVAIKGQNPIISSIDGLRWLKDRSGWGADFYEVSTNHFVMILPASATISHKGLVRSLSRIASRSIVYSPDNQCDARKSARPWNCNLPPIQPPIVKSSAASTIIPYDPPVVFHRCSH